MRILLWLLLLVCVLAAIKKKINGAQNSAKTPAHDPHLHESETQARAKHEQSNQASVESMLCCEVCQVYFPASEAVRKGQQVFCSAEHANR